MKRWSDDIDPASIPDAVLKSERGRRNARRRQSYSGGVLWKRHNPATARCRCIVCTGKRQSATT